MASIRSFCVPLLLCAALGPLAGPVVAQGAAAHRAAAIQAPQARVIVAFKADAASVRRTPLSAQHSAQAVTDEAQRRANGLATHAGVTLAAGRVLGERTQVVMARGLDSATLAARLASHPELAYAEPDRRRRATWVPNDPLFKAGPASGLGPEVGQWYLATPDATIRAAVNAQGAWDIQRASSSVVVAVLDTGAVFDHPDLNGVWLPGYDMIALDSDGTAATANDGNGRDADATDSGDWITHAENAEIGGMFQDCGVSDSSWHGTMVAGIIGAQAHNGIGMAGTAHGVRILPVRVLGKCGGYDSDIIAGMRWAVGAAVPGEPANPTPARVLNMSLGSEGSCSQSYRTVMSEVTRAPYNAVVVAAAGNSTGHAVGTPGNCPGVIAVGGLRHAGTKVGYSDLGPQIAISAPAGNCVNIADGSACLYPILTTTNTGTQRPNAGGATYTDSYNISVGTSFATPIVAGAAALMLAARPALTPTEVTSMLKGAARPFPTSGADNGPDDPTPVTQCRAPDGIDQIQCYCTTSLCGAGMLDVAASVLAARDDLLPADRARQLLDFGQRVYPQYFPGQPATQSLPPFLYRYYASTGVYLGVVVQSDANYVLDGVYVMGGPFGAQPVYVGKLTDFIALSTTAQAASAGPRRMFSR